MGQHPTPPGVELLDVCQTILTGEPPRPPAPEYMRAFDVASARFGATYQDVYQAARASADPWQAHCEATDEALEAFAAVFLVTLAQAREAGKLVAA